MIHPILCPICQKTATDPSKSPFCSERCRKIDFFRWWDGRYAIAEPVAFDPDANLDSLLDDEAEMHKLSDE